MKRIKILHQSKSRKMEESDYDLIATQHFLGHSDPSTTRKYIGLTSEQIVEYTERMSEHLFSAIKTGKFNSITQRSHFPTVQDAVRFLNQQGFHVSLMTKHPESNLNTVSFGAKVIQFRSK